MLNLSILFNLAILKLLIVHAACETICDAIKQNESEVEKYGS